MEIILLVLIVVVFLGLPVLTMRKQSKQVNEIKAFQAQLQPGMIVQMTSGIHARIAEVGETTVDVELSPGVTTTWERNAVMKLVEPAEAVAPAETPEYENPYDNESDIPDDISGLSDESRDNGTSGDNGDNPRA